MTREFASGKRVAILATGDEIISGDIQNTNAREIARHLSDANITPGIQMVTTDHILEIEQAIRGLLQDHHCLIITGGLGPTSDDLTRFALAKATDRALIFHDSVWDHIVARLRHFGYTDPPESNRQQALFPEGADIIHNAAGTAAGCMLTHSEKIIFMLPGPPAECMPMIQDTVLPTLQNAHFSRNLFRKRWLLFGASEGQIAESLDNIAQAGHCMTGYRLCYPYVEFKLFADDKTALTQTAAKITEKVATYLIGDGAKTASEWFYALLIQSGKPLSLCDQATGGILESILKTPETSSFLTFNPSPEKADVFISGLDDYWQGRASIHTRLTLHFTNQQPDITTEIPLRGAKVRYYAAEWVCRKMGESKLFTNVKA